MSSIERYFTCVTEGLSTSSSVSSLGLVTGDPFFELQRFNSPNNVEPSFFLTRLGLEVDTGFGHLGDNDEGFAGDVECLGKDIDMGEGVAVSFNVKRCIEYSSQGV